MQQFTVSPQVLDDLMAAITCQPRYADWRDFSHPAMHQDEIDWKRDAARKIQDEILNPADLPTSFRSPGDADKLIGQLGEALKLTGLMSAPVGDAGLTSLNSIQPDQKQRFCEAMRDLLFGHEPSPERLDRFERATRGFSIKNRWLFATHFLFFLRPDEEILVQPEAMRGLLREIGRLNSWTYEIKGETYAAILSVARSLLDALRDRGASDMVDVQSFIWCFRCRPRVWKLATGKPPLDMWPTWESENVVTIGWDELGNVRGMNEPQFDQRCAELLAMHGQEDGWSKSALKQVWKFAWHMKPGHLVVANRGQQRVLAIGRVVGEYSYTPGVTHGHRRAVEWIDTDPREVSEAGWLNTLLELEWRKLQEIRRLPPPERRFWVFQSASKAYDLQGAVGKLRRIAWRVKQHPKEIHPGDEVFLWESGAQRAIHAVAQVESEPAIMEPDPAEVEFIQDPSVVDPDVPCVWLRIDQVVMPPLERAVLKADPALADVPVFGGMPGTNFPLTAAQADALRALISTTGERPPTGVEPSFDVLRASLRRRQLYFRPEAVANYLLALQTKRFVILSGISGTGKTKLAHEVAKHCADGAGIQVMPVRPDWTDNRGLLGYHNPLTQKYCTTDFLELLRAANADPGRPYFVILDEMNLARVEHYFSDFLSCLESEKPITLHDQGQPVPASRPEAEPVPANLPIPPNVFFTGTVNVDETTYMFSPKVIDRAFTIELNEVRLDYLDGSGAAADCPLALTGWNGDLVFHGNPDARDWEKLGGPQRQTLMSLHALLAKHNRHFGYRVACEIARFVVLADKQAGPDAVQDALDLAILQKVLPKFHGTRAELQDVLKDLLGFAVGDAVAASATALPSSDAGAGPGASDGETTSEETSAAAPASEATAKTHLPRTAAKVRRMLARLEKQGFTAYME